MPEPGPEVADTALETPEDAGPARRATRWRGGRRLSTGHELYWWVEVGIVLFFDLVYESLRDLNSAGAAHAYANAQRLIGWERDLGLYHEEAWQSFFLGHAKWAIIAANYYYGAIYLAV